MESLRALLGVRYHADEYPVHGCWWLCRLLELPAWHRLVLRAKRLPVALASILDGGEPAELTVVCAQLRWLRLKSALPCALPELEGPLSLQIGRVAAANGLGTVDCALLTFRKLVDLHPPLYEAVHLRQAWTDSQLIRTLAHVLRYPPDRIQAALAAGAPLIDKRLVSRSSLVEARFSEKFAIAR